MKGRNMNIAIPVAGSQLCPHFGHCESFAIITVDESGAITNKRSETPPPHEPGILPAWLRSLEVDHVIVGGMGQRAQVLFSEYSISLTTGAPLAAPEELVKAYIERTLECGENLCDH